MMSFKSDDELRRSWNVQHNLVKHIQLKLQTEHKVNITYWTHAVNITET